MYNWIDQLDVYLTAYGADWYPYVEDWKTFAAYGPEDRNYTPAGLLNHHTASTAWYPKKKLTAKCNVYIDPDGHVWLMSAGYQFDSGEGDPAVLGRMRNDVPPSPPRDYTKLERINGNPWFIDIEVGHPGDGSPIPAPQRDALIRTNAAIMEMQGWDPATRLIGHKEWTRRKIDPRWTYNGELDTMDDIRRDTAELLDAGGTAPNINECLPHQIDAWMKAWNKGLITTDSHPTAVLTKGDYFVFQDRAGNLD